MSGKGRRMESNTEEMRKSVKANLPKAGQANAGHKLARLVDRDVLIKSRVRDFGAWNNNVTKPSLKSENGELYETYRDGYANGFHIAEVPLGMSMEDLYYQTFGEGFDGTDIPSRLGEGYVCWKCGHHYNMPITAMMSSRIFDCHVCKTETPAGRLVRSGVIRR